MAYPTEFWDLAGLWTEWILLIMIYSYVLYKETKVYRWAEYTSIATTIAITLIVNMTNVVRLAITPMLAGEYHYIIPIIMGLAIYSMLFTKYRWISRYPTALMVGASLGLGMSAQIKPWIIDAIISTITPPTAGTLFDWFNYCIIAVGFALSLFYFLFTYEQSGPMKHLSKYGRWFIKIGLGGYYGNTVLMRMSLLTGRAKFFLQVLKLVPM